MAIRMTGVRIVHPGTSHEHIQRLAGVDDSSGKPFEGDRLSWYDYVAGGGQAYDRDALGHVAAVKPRINARGTKYVQTVADGFYSDNLLALPRY